jgi:hypothetical protein
VKEQIGRSMEQNRCSEIVPYKYTQLIFDKEKKQYNGEKTVFSRNDAGTNGHPHAKNKESRHALYTFVKVIPK